MPIVILAVDTSGMCGTLALQRDGILIAERELEQSRRRHAQTLIREVQELLQSNQLTPRDVGIIAVSHGPGSFTGLRVGIVFAKTFAYVTGCSVVAVDTLQAVAAAVTDETFSEINQLQVVSDAQREQLFVSRFQREPDDWWQSIGPIDIVDCDAWCSEAALKASKNFAVAGTGLTKVADDLQPSVQRLPEEMWIPRAAQVARIGERLAAHGQFADPFELEPFYLRKSSAEEKREAAMGEDQGAKAKGRNV
ncbi:MAG: tRNA (adenosine(37)-N6)-threonylcarbamoyltransferase complex dimerization subunit type 1 TsaB [Planctomycetota bacterium]|nr:tRNA (adenosine(37)-N6)-threonylcarbamoyltransferase complex dimerization subunit type 1 TsaB [Planctomycetota bacterium]